MLFKLLTCAYNVCFTSSHAANKAWARRYENIVVMIYRVMQRSLNVLGILFLQCQHLLNIVQLITLNNKASYFLAALKRFSIIRPPH